MRAAVRPERTEDLYFVADGSGGHIFAKTLAKRTRNIPNTATAQVPEGEKQNRAPPADSRHRPPGAAPPTPSGPGATGPHRRCATAAAGTCPR